MVLKHNYLFFYTFKILFLQYFCGISFVGDGKSKRSKILVGKAISSACLFHFFSYEQLTKLHPEVENYKLYYAQVSENFLILYSTTICQFHFITSFSVIFAIVAIILIYFYIL